MSLLSIEMKTNIHHCNKTDFLFLTSFPSNIKVMRLFIILGLLNITELFCIFQIESEMCIFFPLLLSVLLLGQLLPYYRHYFRHYLCHSLIYTVQLCNLRPFLQERRHKHFLVDIPKMVYVMRITRDNVIPATN